MSRCTDQCVLPKTGSAQCHCPSCHHTFGGVKGFDRHRSNGECKAPESMGWALNERGVWQEPMPDFARKARRGEPGGARPKLYHPSTAAPQVQEPSESPAGTHA